MRLNTILTTCIVLLSLSSCANYDYARRIVQQGNLLPDSVVQRLKMGMSKEDAAILLGTSLLSPTFNNDRWDYAYTWRKGNHPDEVRRVSLYFAHDRLIRIEQ